jgi:hypothetical protein
MVKQMHQRTRGQEEERQDAEQMRPVLGHKKEQCDGDESKEDQARHGPQTVRALGLGMFVLHGATPAR